MAKKQIILTAAGLASAIMLFACAPAQAKPGRTAISVMERVETHTRAIDATPLHNASGETYLYSLVSAFRKLDTGVYGNIYYMNKRSIDDRTNLGHIFGVDVAADLTGKWKYDIGYSHNASPKRDTIPFNGSDRFAAGLTFKWNPNEKTRMKWEAKTTYSTGTDFSEGRTLSEKISVSNNITKTLNYNAGYTFVWGLTRTTDTQGICSICREQYANQYNFDLNYKMTKKDKLSFGFFFLKNLYKGAKADDMIFRLTYLRTVR